MMQVFNGDIIDHNLNQMKNPSFCLLTSFLILLGTVQACQAVVNTMGCSFSVESTSNDCSTFKYLSCTYQVCSEYSITGACRSYNMETQYDWNTCLSSCCGLTDSPQTYSTLESCQTTNGKTSIIIGISIGGGAFFIAIVSMLYCCYHKRLSICCQSLKNKFWGEVREETNNTDASGSQQQVVSQQVVNRIEEDMGTWTACSQGESLEITDTTCVVCLTNSPTVKLLCKHMFHRDCITNWVCRKRACPLCQSWYFDSIAVFCEKCHARRRDRSFLIDELFNNNPHLCTECKEIA